MKREVRDKKDELYNKSVGLRNLQFTKGVKYEGSQKIREEQDQCYKKWLFYDNMIKASEKVKNK